VSFFFLWGKVVFLSHYKCIHTQERETNATVDCDEAVGRERERERDERDERTAVEVVSFFFCCC